MTDNSIIEQARDVLAKWRKDAATGEWDLSFEWATFTAQSSPSENGYVGDTENPYDARLIVGTAGNPDLLDAIDTLLEQADVWVGDPSAPNVATAAERIAAAIIAADERMSA